jgi:hypothetical protein
VKLPLHVPKGVGILPELLTCMAIMHMATRIATIDKAMVMTNC